MTKSQLLTELEAKIVESEHCQRMALEYEQMKSGFGAQMMKEYTKKADQLSEEIRELQKQLADADKTEKLNGNKAD